MRAVGRGLRFLGAEIRWRTWRPWERWTGGRLVGDLHSAGEMQDIPLCRAEAVLFPGRGRMSSDLGLKTEHFPPPKLGCPWYSTLFGPYCLSNHPHLSVVVVLFFH